MRRRPGMTLLELLCVMAILVIMLGLAMPSIETMYGNIRQTAAADKVRGVFAEMRSRAIEDGQAYRLGVMVGKDRFRVAPDRPEFWEGGDGSVEGYVHEDILRESDKEPEKVTFQVPLGGDSSSSWTFVTSFLPDGTCSNDAEIHLMAEGFRPVAFRVRALTGVIRVQTLSSKEGQ